MLATGAAGAVDEEVTLGSEEEKKEQLHSSVLSEKNSTVNVSNDVLNDVLNNNNNNNNNNEDQLALPVGSSADEFLGSLVSPTSPTIPLRLLQGEEEEENEEKFQPEEKEVKEEEKNEGVKESVKEEKERMEEKEVESKNSRAHVDSVAVGGGSLDPAFLELTRLMEDASVSLGSEEKGSLFARSASSILADSSSSGDNTNHNVKESRRGVWLDWNGLDDRIQNRVDAEEESEEAERQRNLRQLNQTVQTVIEKQELETVLNVPKINLNTKGAGKRYFDSEFALSVYEFAVFALYLHGTLSTAQQLPTNQPIDPTNETAIIQATIAPFLAKIKKAFHIVNSAVDNQVGSRYKRGALLNFLLYRSLLRRQLEGMDKRQYYNQYAFSSAEVYGHWFKMENEELNKKLSVVHGKIEILQQRPNPKPTNQTNPTSAIQKRKKSSSLFFCCSADVDVDVDGGKVGTAPVPIKSESEDTHSTQVTRDDEQFLDRLSESAVMDGYSLLLKVLLQEDNLINDELPDIYTSRALTSHPLSQPTGISAQILTIWADIYRCGNVFRTLTYTDLLLTNLSTSTAYFSSLHTSITTLYAAWDRSSVSKIPMTDQENERFRKFVQESQDWPLLCLSRYNLVLAKEKNALKEALQLVKVTASVLADLEKNKIIPTASDLVKKAIESSAASQYSLITTSAEVNDPSQNESIQFSLTQPDPTKPTSITSISQLLQIIFAVTSFIKDDLDLEETFNSIDQLRLSAVSSEVYYSKAMADCQAFLAKLASMDWKRTLEKEKTAVLLDQLFVAVFRLYRAMNDLRDYINRNVRALPPLKVQAWFEPFIENFLTRKQRQFDDSYVAKIIASDPFNPISSIDQYSHSVIDLLALLYPLTDQFKYMPYSSLHVGKFLTLLASVLTNYVRRLFNEISAVLAKEEGKKSFWGFSSNAAQLNLSIPESTLVQINCIYTIKKQFISLLECVEIGKAYDHPAASALPPPINSIDETNKKLNNSEKETENIVKRDKDNSLKDSSPEALPPPHSSSGSGSASLLTDAEEEAGWSADESLTLPPSLSVYPGVVSGFGYISNVLPSLTSRIGVGLGFFVSNHLTLLIDNPSNDISLEGMTKEMSNVCTYLLQHLTYFRSHLYSLLFCSICAAALADECAMLEKMLVYPKKGDYRQRLKKDQVKRVENIKIILVKFYTETLAFPGYFLKKIEDSELNRLDYLLWLLSSPSTKILHELEAMDDQITAGITANQDKLSFAEKEAIRIQTPPYLTRAQLLSLLNFRVEKEGETDKEVLEVVNGKKNKSKGLLAKVFG